MNYSEKNLKNPFAVYDSDTPVILKQGYGHKTWYEFVDPKQGYNHAAWKTALTASVKSQQ